MSKKGILVAIAFAGSFAMIASPASAGSGASGCDDLSSIAETPAIDFESQIQPIFDDCTGCHGEAGPAGLDLRQEASYGNLVGVASVTNSSRLRVAPFDPQTSTLFLAVSCDSPDGPGFRMPGTNPKERALIRDWIAQGAPAEPPAPVTVPVNADWMLGALFVLLMALAGLHFRRARVGG